MIILLKQTGNDSALYLFQFLLFIFFYFRLFQNNFPYKISSEDILAITAFNKIVRIDKGRYGACLNVHALER